jgi:hypothetical protein
VWDEKACGSLKRCHERADFTQDSREALKALVKALLEHETLEKGRSHTSLLSRKGKA